jgi:hypothetical protein
MDGTKLVQDMTQWKALVNTVLNLWERYHQASTACYGDSFTLWRRSVLPVKYELDCYK